MSNCKYDGSGEGAERGEGFRAFGSLVKKFFLFAFHENVFHGFGFITWPADTMLAFSSMRPCL
jgi:hypothetical protein